MPHAHKIATCCYCGTRAALVLRGENRHELSCASCGAPLHEMKRLPVQAVSAGETKRRVPPQSNFVKKVVRRKKKFLIRRLAREAFDLLEDIFD